MDEKKQYTQSHNKTHALHKYQKKKAFNEFFLTAQNLKLFGQKLQHFSNDAFQKCLLFGIEFDYCLPIGMFNSRTSALKISESELFRQRAMLLRDVSFGKRQVGIHSS